jgi:hypothetical protein
MTQTLLQECKDIIRDLVDNEALYFDTAVEVKLTPHTYPFLAWGVCVSPDNELYVLDGQEQWHHAALTDMNANLLVGSLYQRLRLMRVQYRKAG